MIGVTLYYSISIHKIHEIVIKFHMSNDSFKYYHRLCIYKYMISYSIHDKLVMATGHAMPMLINLHLFE